MRNVKLRQSEYEDIQHVLKLSRDRQKEALKEIERLIEATVSSLHDAKEDLKKFTAEDKKDENSRYEAYESIVKTEKEDLIFLKKIRTHVRNGERKLANKYIRSRDTYMRDLISDQIDAWLFPTEEETKNAIISNTADDLHKLRSRLLGTIKA